jgi:hypothetical protein
MLKGANTGERVGKGFSITIAKSDHPSASAAAAPTASAESGSRAAPVSAPCVCVCHPCLEIAAERYGQQRRHEPGLRPRQLCVAPRVRWAGRAGGRPRVYRRFATPAVASARLRPAPAAT